MGTFAGEVLLYKVKRQDRIRDDKLWERKRPGQVDTDLENWYSDMEMD